MPDIYNTGSSLEEGKTSPAEEQKTKTVEFFEKFQESLEDKIKSAKNDLDVKSTEFNSALATRRYSMDKLCQAEDAVEEYTKFSNCISNTVGQDVVEVDGKIDKIIASSSSIKSKLEIALNAIKDAKDKMAIVDGKACKLSDALKESCNADQLRILEGISCFDDLAQSIIKKSDDVHDTADDTYEAGIKVSAALAFANVESLKEYGITLQEKGQTFQSDVADNLVFNNEKLAMAQTEVTDSLMALSTAECNKYEAYLKCDSLTKSKGISLDKDMSTIGTELLGICHTLQGTFGYDDETRLTTEAEILKEEEENESNDWNQPNP